MKSIVQSISENVIESIRMTGKTTTNTLNNGNERQGYTVTGINHRSPMHTMGSADLTFRKIQYLKNGTWRDIEWQ